jgi:hypothetical protein
MILYLESLITLFHDYFQFLSFKKRKKLDVSWTRDYIERWEDKKIALCHEVQAYKKTKEEK